MAMTNALAYRNRSSIFSVKKFLVQAPVGFVQPSAEWSGPRVTKFFLPVIYKCF
jgi:hypothetical protein